MQLREWRKSSDLTLQACADAMGLAGGGRTFQRLERGEVNCDADMVAKIAALTGEAVGAQDMHDVRLAWLKANRPDKFSQDADRVSTAGRSADLAAAPAFSSHDAGDAPVEAGPGGDTSSHPLPGPAVRAERAA